MRHLHKTVMMPYAPSQVYALVNDIAAYPQFLPWCGGTQVLASTDGEKTARIIIAKGPVRLAFVTVNQLQLNRRIDMRLKEGPFRSLQGSWVFESNASGGCQVTLQLDFEFNSRLLAMTVGPVFEQVVSTLVEAFLHRARQVYG